MRKVMCSHTLFVCGIRRESDELLGENKRIAGSMGGMEDQPTSMCFTKPGPKCVYIKKLYLLHLYPVSIPCEEKYRTCYS